MRKDGDTYVFTAPEFDTYTLIVSEGTTLALKATKSGVSYLPVGGQTDAKFTGTKSGTYVCKVTWNMGSSDDYTLISQPVEYTAPSIPAISGYPVVELKNESSDGKVSFSKNHANAGETVTITVTPDKHYGVEKVIVRDANGNEIETTKNADGTYSFKMPYGKVTVEAVFNWENPFIDVAEDVFYTDAVEWALKNGVTEGTGNNNYSPNAACTRGQMVTFLYRYYGK